MRVIIKGIIISPINLIAVIVICSTAHAQIDESYLNPPQIIKNPQSKSGYLVQNRTSSGIPSLAVTGNGRIWVTWYTGITHGVKVEDCPASYVVIAKSDDRGNTWEDVLVIDPDGLGPVRAFDPQLWIDPEGCLWIFWSQEIKAQREITSRTGSPYGVWAITINDPDATELIFDDPKRLTDGVMMCKPIEIKSGEWVLPVSTWKYTENSAKMVVSVDQGNTWHVRGDVCVNMPGMPRRTADEHMIVERHDGSLWMLVRTPYGIGESTSHDKGYTWSNLKLSDIKHPSARFFICRLNSGNLLLVKHGPIDMLTGRSHLMAFISKDDGIIWSEGLLLDEGRVYSNDLNTSEGRRITYPDGQQVADGTIFITYDYGRQEDQLILMVSFTEEDILSGSANNMVKVHQGRRIVSKGGL